MESFDTEAGNVHSPMGPLVGASVLGPLDYSLVNKVLDDDLAFRMRFAELKAKDNQKLLEGLKGLDVKSLMDKTPLSMHAHLNQIVLTYDNLVNEQQKFIAYNQGISSQQIKSHPDYMALENAKREVERSLNTEFRPYKNAVEEQEKFTAKEQNTSGTPPVLSTDIIRESLFGKGASPYIGLGYKLAAGEELGAPIGSGGQKLPKQYDRLMKAISNVGSTTVPSLNWEEIAKNPIVGSGILGDAPYITYLTSPGEKKENNAQLKAAIASFAREELSDPFKLAQTAQNFFFKDHGGFNLSEAFSNGAKSKLFELQAAGASKEQVKREMAIHKSNIENFYSNLALTAHATEASAIMIDALGNKLTPEQLTFAKEKAKERLDAANKANEGAKQAFSKLVPHMPQEHLDAWFKPYELDDKGQLNTKTIKNHLLEMGADASNSKVVIVNKPGTWSIKSDNLNKGRGSGSGSGDVLKEQEQNTDLAFIMGLTTGESESLNLRSSLSNASIGNTTIEKALIESTGKTYAVQSKSEDGFYRSVFIDNGNIENILIPSESPITFPKKGEKSEIIRAFHIFNKARKKEGTDSVEVSQELFFSGATEISKNGAKDMGDVPLFTPSGLTRAFSDSGFENVANSYFISMEKYNDYLNNNPDVLKSILVSATLYGKKVFVGPKDNASDDAYIQINRRRTNTLSLKDKATTANLDRILFDNQEGDKAEKSFTKFKETLTQNKKVYQDIINSNAPVQEKFDKLTTEAAKSDEGLRHLVYAIGNIMDDKTNIDKSKLNELEAYSRSVKVASTTPTKKEFAQSMMKGFFSEPMNDEIIDLRPLVHTNGTTHFDFSKNVSKIILRKTAFTKADVEIPKTSFDNANLDFLLTSYVKDKFMENRAAVTTQLSSTIGSNKGDAKEYFGLNYDKDKDVYKGSVFMPLKRSVDLDQVGLSLIDSRLFVGFAGFYKIGDITK